MPTHTRKSATMEAQRSPQTSPVPSRIIIPADAEIWPHELKTAEALARAGHSVEFLSIVEGAVHADIIMDGIVWEMKCPETKDIKYIQRIPRRATKQSHNVILDSMRLSTIRDNQLERELRRLAPLIRSIKRLILVDLQS